MATTTAAVGKPTWQEIAKTAQEYRDSTLNLNPPIPEVPTDLPLDVTAIPNNLLSPEAVAITQTPPEELVKSLALGRLTSLAVTTAFLQRAGVAQKLVWLSGPPSTSDANQAKVNCITELLSEKAIARAKYLDDFFTLHKKPIGPLHGLPISVKEHIAMKGLGLNIGFVSWWGREAEEDAYLLEILWEAGCVFYVRTTEPQALMHLETSSNLYGVTTNPFNRNLSAGGSSGGEGALMGLRGSCLGVGSDIGGSIRSPAANCGVYGLRPTSYRLPLGGFTATMLGSEQIVPVCGPFGTTLEGVKLFMKTVLAAKPWLLDPSLVPFPWRDQHSHLETRNGKKLKVGVIWHDEVVLPHPPVRRALREVVEKLRAIDTIEVVDWKPLRHAEAWEIITSLYFCDGASEEIQAIEESGEPFRPLSVHILKDNPYVKRLSIEELWYWTLRRDAYRIEYAKAWNDTANKPAADEESARPVDVILCPATPGASTPLDTAKYWCYTSQWNLLDYPALVFPVSKVDPQIDLAEQEFEFMTQQDLDNHHLCLLFPLSFPGFFRIYDMHNTIPPKFTLLSCAAFNNFA